MTHSPPDWMLKHVQDARQLFGVGGPEWHITVKLSDKPVGDSGNDGGADVNCVYLNATIEMQEILEDSDTVRAEIFHEVLHIPHEEIDHLVYRIIDELSAGSRQRYADLYSDVMERFVQRISRSICANVRKTS